MLGDGGRTYLAGYSKTDVKYYWHKMVRSPLSCIFKEVKLELLMDRACCIRVMLSVTVPAEAEECLVRVQQQPPLLAQKRCFLYARNAQLQIVLTQPRRLSGVRMPPGRTVPPELESSMSDESSVGDAKSYNSCLMEPPHGMKAYTGPQIPGDLRLHITNL